MRSSPSSRPAYPREPEAQGHGRRRGQRRRDVRAGARDARLRGRRARRHQGGPAAGQGARHQPDGRRPRLRAERRGSQRLRGDCGLVGRRRHRRPAALARHVARRPRRDEREDRHGRHGEGDRAEPRRDPDRRVQPARRDVSRREERLGLAEAACVRDGRDPRHGALRDVHLLGNRRVGEGRAGDGARRPRRPDGADRVGDDRGRRTAAQARLGRSDPGDGGAHREGRRRAREPDGHLGLVRAGRSCRSDGRLDHARRAARTSVHRVSRG